MWCADHLAAVQLRGAGLLRAGGVQPQAELRQRRGVARADVQRQGSLPSDPVDWGPSPQFPGLTLGFTLGVLPMVWNQNPRADCGNHRPVRPNFISATAIAAPRF